MDGFVALGTGSGRAERLRMRQGVFTGPDLGPGAGQRAGQSGDPAAGSGA